MNSYNFEDEHLHFVTPLKYSRSLSDLLPGNPEVYMKLENCQPSGSFKIRGIGRLAQKLKREGCQRLLTASSGNAGVAASCASQLIGLPCTVYVPEIASALAIDLIKKNEAEVVVSGAHYSETEIFAKKEAEKPQFEFLNPYDHPEVWAGHSTMVDELKTQLPNKPSAIVLSVGGGGLLLGVLKGLERVGWQDVPVVAMETLGAHSFNLSVKANKIVALEKITSVATCLGVRTIAPHLLEVLPQFHVISQVITDAQAVESCIKFADHERILVEPGCGTALAALYCGVLEKLQSQGSIPSLTTGPIVVVVCGGNGVSFSLLQKWATMFDVKFPSS